MHLFWLVADKCSVGFMGKYCKEMCHFPSYGYGCQQNCLCPKSNCHFEKGCQRKKISSKSKKRFEFNSHEIKHLLPNLWWCQIPEIWKVK